MGERIATRIMRVQQIADLICRLQGHTFKTFCDGTKRRCAGCGREEWLFSKPFPRIGEAKYSWRRMDWKR